MKSQANWRWCLRRLHLILAIVAGLPLIVLAATGALLVFPETIDALISGVPRVVPVNGQRLSYSEIVQALDAALPSNDQATRIVFEAAPGSVVTASSVNGVSLVLDPYSGRILRASKSWTPARFLTWLHVTLALGTTGTTIAGFESLLLCGLCATGLLLWWPVGRWRTAYFLVRRDLGWRRCNYDLHRAIGLYSTWALLLIASSGAAMAFHKQAAALVYFATSSGPLDSSRPKIVFDRYPAISADQAVEIASAEFPGWLVYRLYVPVPRSPCYRVFLNPPASFAARHSEARLEIHPQTGEIFREESQRTRSRGDRLLMWLLPLHFGTWGGFLMQCLYVCGSLAPLILLATGGTIWCCRRRKQRRARSRPPAARAAGGAPAC